jgi:CDP-diglyceride synthetase
MDIKNMPVLLLLLTTCFLVILAIEFGYRIGRAIRKRQEVESESSASSISGYILALLAFIIAFTFGIVTDRYQIRKDLVREEASLIRTAWMRADFLPDTEQLKTKNLIQEYTSLRLTAVLAHEMDQIQEAMIQCAVIREQLWNTAVTEARKDMNSDVAALYIESLNDLANINASRIVVGLHTRIPEGIWEVLFILMLLGMFSIGYQASISGSKRSWSTLIMAASFALVIVMIEVLDRPQSKLVPVSQYPMEHLLGEMKKTN